jgi:ABC-type multidrug transport system ATPase subunit
MAGSPRKIYQNIDDFEIHRREELGQRTVETGYDDVRVVYSSLQVRLNFARALLNKPKLLFLDEPTTGLDPVNARIVMNKIRELRDRGTTVFLTTHNMNVADEVCDRVAFLVDGRIRLIDSPRELKLRFKESALLMVPGSRLWISEGFVQ